MRGSCKVLFDKPTDQLGNGGQVYKGVVEDFPILFTQINAENGKMDLKPGDIVSMYGSGRKDANGIPFGHVAIVKSLAIKNSVITGAIIIEQWADIGQVRAKEYAYTSASTAYFYLHGVARPKF